MDIGGGKTLKYTIFYNKKVREINLYEIRKIKGVKKESVPRKRPKSHFEKPRE
jgi:hypothetical protein